MRKIIPAFLLTPALLLGSVGCRQTTGPMSAGSISSASPLSPVSAGQTPSLGIFGAPTRVSPPATGSFSQPNAYASPITQPQAQYGGSAPAASFGQMPTGVPAFQPIDGPSFNPQPIGSGVQTASWTETNSNIPSPVNDLRSGGMQVIDLTGAPNPPGYRPVYPAQPVVQGGGYPNAASNWQPPMPQPDLTPHYGSPIAAPETYQSPTNAPFVPRDQVSPTNPVAPSNAFVPDPGRIASQGLTPLPTPTQSRSLPPRAASNFSSPASVPSTEASPPTNQPTNLSWRRPGTQY